MTDEEYKNFMAGKSEIEGTFTIEEIEYKYILIYEVREKDTYLMTLLQSSEKRLYADETSFKDIVKNDTRKGLEHRLIKYAKSVAESHYKQVKELKHYE